MSDFIYDNFGWFIVALIALTISSMVSVANKEAEQKKIFMASCIQDKKQYECDVLWGQTAESKQTSDMARNVAIGAAAGAIAGSRGR